MMRTCLIVAVTTMVHGLQAANAGELPSAEPSAVGLDAARLEALGPALRKLVDEGRIAGGVALVVRNGKVAYVDAFGERDRLAKSAMTKDTIFAIASMTKPITCVAAMQLIEQGKLGLDDPVTKHLPELASLRVVAPEGTPAGDDGAIPSVALERPVTIRHLFSHTSGFSYGGFMSDDERLSRSYSEAGVESRDVKTLAEQVERLGRTLLAHQPGEGWTYGMSHDVLARVIEVVSGQGIDQYLKQHVFEPLDMWDTGFFVPGAKRERVATIYRQSGAAGLLPLPRSFGSETLFGGGAGLFSTARDYARFCQMLLNGGGLDGASVLSPESIRLMTTAQVPGRPAFGASYGLGFGLDVSPMAEGKPAVLERYYWSGLFSTSFWVDPRHELAGVLMLQIMPTGQSGAERVFRETVEAAIEPAIPAP